MFDLKGKTALVTGSTQGIGYAIAKLLIERGAEVYIHCPRDSEKARRVAKELGSTRFVTADLAERDAAERIYAVTGPLDIVVANASVQYRNEWYNITNEEFDKQIDVNLRSTLALMQAYIPGMQKRGFGRFITVGSVQEHRPHVNMAIYAASKCAIVSLVKNVAKQVAKDGVTVNNLAPGVIATQRNEQALSDPEYSKKVLAGIPAGYAGTAEDCAAAALLLCSPEGRYITGVDLLVDGGMSL